MGFDVIALIKSLGYIGVWAAVFLESGVLFFFFLPGDSLLFTAGFLASQNILNLWILMAGCFIAAILGNILGYYLGAKIGLKLFESHKIPFLKKEHLDITREFYEKHGALAIVMARFMPIIRTFAPFLAGIVQMNFAHFMFYNLIGAIVWAIGITYMGYLFGQIIPPEQIDQYLLPVIILVIIVSLLPSFYHFWKEKRLKKQRAQSQVQEK